MALLQSDLVQERSGTSKRRVGCKWYLTPESVTRGVV